MAIDDDGVLARCDGAVRGGGVLDGIGHDVQVRRVTGERNSSTSVAAMVNARARAGEKPGLIAGPWS